MCPRELDINDEVARFYAEHLPLASESTQVGLVRVRRRSAALVDWLQASGFSRSEIVSEGWGRVTLLNRLVDRYAGGSVGVVRDGSRVVATIGFAPRRFGRRNRVVASRDACSGAVDG